MTQQKGKDVLANDIRLCQKGAQVLFGNGI